MSTFFQMAGSWLISVRADLYLVTGGMAVIWAASEVVVGYPDQPMRALRTWGAWLLMIANAFFACMVLALTLALVPESASTWMALGVGISWQTMLRGGVNIQPLPISSAAGASEGVGVPFNELYARLQAFCVGQIQRHLVSGRVTLMEQVIAELDITELAHTARLVTAALSSSTPKAEQYIQRIESDESRTSEQREILLISLILNNRGADILRKRVRAQRERR